MGVILDGVWDVPDNDYNKSLDEPVRVHVVDICFVATACYGVDDSITETLRSWRDRQKNVLSVLFIKTYYAGVGKAGAKILNKFPILKPLGRKAIKAFMWVFRIS